MVDQNKEWKRLLFQMLFALGAVWLLGFAYQRFYEGSPEDSIEAGFITVAIYLVASMCLGLLNFVINLAYFYFFGVKQMEEAWLHVLRENAPPPADWHPARIDYLASIVDDDSGEFSVLTRCKAAGLYAKVQTLISLGGFTKGLAISQALDNAARRYRDEAPRLQERPARSEFPD